MRKLRAIAFIAGLLIPGAVPAVKAQDPGSQVTATNAQADEEKAAAEKKATAMLEQIVGEVQLLKLPENRIRVQIAAADMLWKSNEARARSLFSLAADGLAEMVRGTESGNVQRWAGQLRQELVLTAAQHDASLAYQLLAATQSLTTTPDPSGNSFRRPSPDANLEQDLLARIAAIDPKLAAQKLEEALSSGQYPNTLPQVLSALQLQDKEAATKLTAKVVSKLQSENMLANTQAGTLSLFLLRAGPLPAQTASIDAQAVAIQSTSNPAASNQMPSGASQRSVAQAVLGEAAFKDLMNTVIDAALRTTRQPASDQGGRTGGRGRGNFGAAQNPNQTTPTDGQLEQQNARRLLSGLQALLPQIDQYLPTRATTVRNKMTELGIGNNSRMAFNQINTLMQQGTADSLLAAAPAAPPALQSRLYQQAAQKALDEGNVDRARQIANDHLDATTRDRVLQKVDFQVIAKKVEAEQTEQLQQTLANLRSDDERIDLLLQLAAQAQENTGAQESASQSENDAHAALKFLNEAQRLANRRATNYSQFDQQLRIADAFATVDPSRSFDVLDPGIAQLNELLSAAALLSGFEVNIFKDGEMPLAGGSGLSDMVARYGQELATLAKIDFARAESSANRFQLAEPRLLSKLAIVRNVLGVPQVAPMTNGYGGPRRFARRGQ